MSGESFASAATSAVPTFKKFVSEEEIEEKRRQRQEEWEKVRKPDQPQEAPEEVVDNRSLYDRLQEQKDKKQSEYDEQFALKNQVKGLEKDETDFLEFVSTRQEELLVAREKEDSEVLAEYRQSVQITTSKTENSDVKKTSSKPQIGASKGKSQMSLLAGAVKRKSSAAENEDEDKKRKLTETGDDSSSTTNQGNTGSDRAKVVAILPGMGEYTDSSDSECSSSESDIEVNAFPKKCVKAITMKQIMNQMSH